MNSMADVQKSIQNCSTTDRIFTCNPIKRDETPDWYHEVRVNWTSRRRWEKWNRAFKHTHRGQEIYLNSLNPVTGNEVSKPSCPGTGYGYPYRYPNRIWGILLDPLVLAQDMGILTGILTGYEVSSWTLSSWHRIWVSLKVSSWTLLFWYRIQGIRTL